MTWKVSRLPRRVLTATAAMALVPPLALIGSAPSHAAYDVITVKDGKNDIGGGKEYKFPDVVKTTYQHVDTGKAATLRVVVQFRKDARWESIHGAELDANRYTISMFPNADYSNHYLSIRTPKGKDKRCKVCRIEKQVKKRRLVLTVPYSKIGRPSNISLGVFYIAQGILTDKVAKPSRPLY